MDISMILCYIVGGIFAYFGIASFARTLHDKRVCTQEIVARVVEYDIQKDSGGKNGMPHNHYFPIFSFTAEGQDIRKAGNIGYSSQIFPLGTEVNVLYESGNPENFIMPTDKSSSSAISLILGVMGLGLIAITILRQIGIINV